jgi:hypothetical protein
MRFVNRERELARLEEWWKEPASRLAMVWGRRRVGKTALVQKFSSNKPVLYHIATGRPAADELAAVSRLAVSAGIPTLRDLAGRPFRDWDDCLDSLAEIARESPLLLVLDEFPELTAGVPHLETLVRAFLDRSRGRTALRLLLCGSAVRTMAAIQEERAPLYGRIDLSLRLHPFDPHESAAMLPHLRPAERALVWGIVGGVPPYLAWWNEEESVSRNLERLLLTPGGRLLMEGDYVLATEGGKGELARQILFVVASGRTKYSEIEQSVGASPSRVIDNLLELRLLERLAPVTEVSTRTRRSSYRVADNFLAFWFGVVSKYRAEIDRGLGKTILPVVVSELDDFMGPRWEDAFRQHLRRLAVRGELGPDGVAVGPFWAHERDSVEIDAVVLAGRSRQAVLVGEAKWAGVVDGAQTRRALEDKARRLPHVSDDLRYAVCARDKVTSSRSVRAFTARSIFGR